MKKWLLAIAALLCASAGAQTVKPLASPHYTFVDSAGNPCAGCKVYTYLAGTTSPTPTYTDSTGAVQNTNPIILDASGSANIWVGFASLKLVVQDTTGATLWTVDNIPSGSSSTPCGPANTIQIANSTVTGFDCDTRITINKLIHSINVGGPLPANHFSLTNLNPVTTPWTFDVTTKGTAAKSIGLGTPAASKYIDGATGTWTTLPSPGPGTVTSVGITPTGAPLSVSGSPVTGSGNIGLTLAVTGTGAKAATSTSTPADGCATWSTGNVGSTGTPCDLGTSSLTANGYQTFGSGLIMQWAAGTSQASSAVTQDINFPIACPTQVFIVIPSSYASVFDDTSMPVWVVISNNLTKATVAMQRVPDHGFDASTPRIEVLCK